MEDGWGGRNTVFCRSVGAQSLMAADEGHKTQDPSAFKLAQIYPTWTNHYSIIKPRSPHSERFHTINLNNMTKVLGLLKIKFCCSLHGRRLRWPQYCFFSLSWRTIADGSRWRAYKTQDPSAYKIAQNYPTWTNHYSIRIPRVLTQREAITSEATVARGGAQQPQEKKPVKVRSRAAVFAIKTFFSPLYTTTTTT